MPDVTVVMGVRDAASHLEVTIDSVVRQEGVDLEFVIVDDGSSDGTTGILRDRASRDPRIRLLEQEHRGLTEALIRGCAEARAPYLARQDAGDVSHPGRLRELKASLEADEGLAFVSSRTEIRGPRLEYLYTVEGGPPTPDGTVLRVRDGAVDLVDGPTHHGSVMMRRASYERAGGYRPEFYLAQDKDLWFRLAEIGSYRTVPRPLYSARFLPSNRTSSYRGLQTRLRELAREAADRRRRGVSEGPILERAAALRPEREEAASSRTLARGNYFVGEVLRKNGDPRCRTYFLETLRLDPLNVKSYLRIAQTMGARLGLRSPVRGEG